MNITQQQVLASLSLKLNEEQKSLNLRYETSRLKLYSFQSDYYNLLWSLPDVERKIVSRRKLLKAAFPRSIRLSQWNVEVHRSYSSHGFEPQPPESYFREQKSKGKRVTVEICVTGQGFGESYSKPMFSYGITIQLKPGCELLKLEDEWRMERNQTIALNEKRCRIASVIKDIGEHATLLHLKLTEPEAFASLDDACSEFVASL
jgi:hypothetical protein